MPKDVLFQLQFWQLFFFFFFIHLPKWEMPVIYKYQIAVLLIHILMKEWYGRNIFVDFKN